LRWRTAPTAPSQKRGKNLGEGKRRRNIGICPRTTNREGQKGVPTSPNRKKGGICSAETSSKKKKKELTNTGDYRRNRKKAKS